MARPADILSFCTVARPGACRPSALGLPLSAVASIANRSGASMDLAMAMGLALFGIFTGSTVFFFYRLPR
jgi:hypothetical protein